MDDNLQPMALVLLNKDIFQLDGDDVDRGGPLLLAVGDPW